MGRKYALLPSAPELIKLTEAGKSHEEIADMYNTTRQAVSMKIRRAMGSGATTLLPWKVAVEHAHRSTIYGAAVAYAKWKVHGQQVDANEKREAGLLEKVAADINSVLIYDRERGFQWRSRRRTDTSIIAAE